VTTPTDRPNAPPSVTLRSRREAGANSKWNVYLDHIIDEGGAEVEDYLVIAPKNPAPGLITGVCVIPVFEGKIGLLRFYRHPINEEVWEAPRGFIDKGETPEVSALRELGEEAGLDCHKDDLIYLGTYTPEASTLAARGALFAACKCFQTEHPAHDEAGLGDIHFLPPEQVLKMSHQSEIEDASTLIAIHRLAARLPDIFNA
jgi:ADP-ribose pyrophosphatase